MRSLLVALALLFLASATAAQAQATAQSSPSAAPAHAVAADAEAAVYSREASRSCPLGVSVQRQPRGAVEQVAPPHRRAMGLSIRLSSIDSRLIAQAQVTARGIAGGHILPAATHSSPLDVSETFTLAPGTLPAPRLESVVYTQKLTGVRWVEINEVEYADGTHWRQSAGSVCRVAPDLYELVDATTR